MTMRHQIRLELKKMIRHQAIMALHRIAHHPSLNLAAGLILLLTGMLEALETLVEGLFAFPFGAHHGIAFFGFLQMIKALPDVMKGLRFVDDSEFPPTPGPESNAGHEPTAGTI